MTDGDRVARPAVPRVLLLTDGRAVPEGRTLGETVAAALDGGVDGVVVRERHLPATDRQALGHQLRTLADAAGSRAALLWAAPVPADQRRSMHPEQGHGPVTGLHLRSADPFPDRRRPALVGRSCHTAAGLRRAADEGCDYVTISPVAATSSKPGYGPALGPDGLRALLRQAAYLTGGAPRVLALGGVEPGSARQWVEAGAHGLAVMGAVMRAGDPADVAARLVAEVVG